MKTLIKIFTSILILSSCNSVTSLNLKEHQFDTDPKRIVWLQIDGLSSEHLGLLKFSSPKEGLTTGFEKMTCVGHMWDYSTHELRPSSNTGFISQVTGKKNVNGKCDDYTKKPVWNYLSRQGFETGILEKSLNHTKGFLGARKCKEDSFLEKARYWGMNLYRKGKPTLFHASDSKINIKVGEMAFDRSCKSGKCFISFEENAGNLFKKMKKIGDESLFIIKNSIFSHYLQRGKLKKATDELVAINKVVNYFNKAVNKDKNLLFLITGSAPIGIEYPQFGKDWLKFEKKGLGVLYKDTQLLSPVFASGARSENFCGVYEQSQIMSRVFTRLKDKGLELDYINPFK